MVLVPVTCTLVLVTVTCDTFWPPKELRKVSRHSCAEELFCSFATNTFPVPTVESASNAICTVAFQAMFDVVWPLKLRVYVPAKIEVAVTMALF